MPEVARVDGQQAGREEGKRRKIVWVGEIGIDMHHVGPQRKDHIRGKEKVGQRAAMGEHPV